VTGGGDGGAPRQVAEVPRKSFPSRAPRGGGKTEDLLED
jgi:hypothetical protein